MLFVHDHVFLKKDEKYYTSGSLNDRILGRYSGWFKNFSVFAYEKEATEKEDYILNEGNLASNCNFILSTKKRNLKSLIKKITLLKKTIQDDDGVISRMSFLGVIAIHYAKKYKKPYLIEMVADPWDSLWNHSKKGKILAPFMVYITKYYVKNAPTVLYVTSEYLQNKYPTKGVSIGISDVEIEINKELLENRIERINVGNNESLTISTLANVDVKYKGQEYVIRALPSIIKTYPKVQYKLYGSGDGKRLKEVVSELRLENYVSFEGQIPHNQIGEKLANTDIYIQPSLQEGLPRSVVEAMSTGCLVLGAKTGGIPELIQSKYVFKRKDYLSIASSILNLEKNDFIKSAQVNFDKSKEFSSKILDKKRNSFYQEFVQKNSL